MSQTWLKTLPWGLLASSVIASVFASPPATALARAFFAVTLGGAVVCAVGALGLRAQLAAAGGLLLLVLGQGGIQRSIPPPPSSQWTIALDTQSQRLQHTMAPPVRTKAWGRWWARAHSAAIYVCARGPLQEENGLDLFLGERRLARITEELAVGPRPQPTSVGFYRVPIERSALETGNPLTFELLRAADSVARPVEVCGTFTHRPSAGLESSRFFDGVTWRSPGATQRGRYIVELRLEESPGRAVAALY